jgi:hypothetical protein
MPIANSSSHAPSAGAKVREYLSAMKSRDIAIANSCLAEGFQMTFPGGVVFHSLEELIAWGRTRYRFVTKTYERFDEAITDSGTVVYCFGTRAGEWPDGSHFEGIRFIDRFTVRDNQLVDQQVWNDLAESTRM